MQITCLQLADIFSRTWTVLKLNRLW